MTTKKDTAATNVAIAETTDAPAPDRLGDAIRAWMVEHIHGSVIAQNTEAFNHLTAKLPALKAALAPIVKE